MIFNKRYKIVKERPIQAKEKTAELLKGDPRTVNRSFTSTQDDNKTDSFFVDYKIKIIFVKEIKGLWGRL